MQSKNESAEKGELAVKSGIWFSPCSDLELPGPHPSAKPEFFISEISAFFVHFSDFFNLWNGIKNLVVLPLSDLWLHDAVVVMDMMTWKGENSPGRQLRVLPGSRRPLWRGSPPSVATARTRRGNPRGPTPGEAKFMAIWQEIAEDLCRTNCPCPYINISWNIDTFSKKISTKNRYWKYQYLYWLRLMTDYCCCWC